MFTVNLMTSDDDQDIDYDAAVDVDLTLTDEQLRLLTKEVAGVVGDFLRSKYPDTEITVCT